MCAEIPDVETDDSRKGTAVHWIGAERLVGNDDAGIKAPNGVIIDDDMIDAADIYVNEVLSTTDAPIVEQPVKMPEIHEQCWGTPDAWSFDIHKLTLNVWDFKYGHSSVDAVGNRQLICYALGALREVTNGKPLDDNNIHVNMNIVQPRCYDGSGPVKRWSIPAVDLRPYVNQLHMSAVEALGNQPFLHVGSHCQHCKARHQCPALQQASAEFADYAQVAVPQVMSLDALGYEIAVLNQAYDLIKFRKNALETEALTRSLNGEQVPGVTAEQGVSNNKWLYGNDEVKSLGDLMGVNLMRDPVPCTPTQAIALFKKAGIDAEVINSYYGRQPTAMKLVADDNTKAKLIFGE